MFLNLNGLVVLKKQLYMEFLVKESPLLNQNLQKCTTILNYCLPVCLFSKIFLYTVTFTMNPPKLLATAQCKCEEKMINDPLFGLKN